jgi:hypothetical protein
MKLFDSSSYAMSAGIRFVKTSLLLPRDGRWHLPRAVGRRVRACRPGAGTDPLRQVKPVRLHPRAYDHIDEALPYTTRKQFGPRQVVLLRGLSAKVAGPSKTAPDHWPTE